MYLYYKYILYSSSDSVKFHTDSQLHRIAYYMINDHNIEDTYIISISDNYNFQSSNKYLFE